MAFTVTVQPSGKQFQADAGECILDAALRHSVILPYGCKNGACGSCKARVIDGQVAQGAHHAAALRDAEATRGFALMCCASALSDLTIEARVVAAAGDLPVRRMPCRRASWW